jgi:asparagine synthase (glutamine-hydrolysing)
MCGIFALLNSGLNKETIHTEFIKGKNRGPEFSKLDMNYLKMVLGFHRLAINGLNEESNQPLVLDDIILVCNGEIYNYTALYEYMNVQPTTGSDCEVIIHLYLKYGIEQTLIMLDGVYSFVLLDYRIGHDLSNNLFVARDPYGVRPLYSLKSKQKEEYPVFGFASELKCLEHFYNMNIEKYSIEVFLPGTYSVFNLSNQIYSLWKPVKENIPHFLPSFSYNIQVDRQNKHPDVFHTYSRDICSYLQKAVDKRCLTTERPIACLLSGGLDSSLISALVSDYYRKNNYSTPLETYSIGLKGSEDLKYARIVADWIESNHTEVIVTEKEMFDAIPEVIYAIESYDTTTVRASIGNYLLGKYISKHSEAKVIFNGDGSDEILGGYLYMNHCPDDIEFDKETRRLLKDIHLFDVLRSDKSISSHGLEPRTPFLDRNFVHYMLSIPPFFRNHTNFDHLEKSILRNSFTYFFLDNRGRRILSDPILWRKKEAFSDGVSSQGRSLYVILQEFISYHLNVEESTHKYTPCIDTEKFYYKKIFDGFFPNCSHIIPYFWMPKYVDAKDPSARTLQMYTKDEEESLKNEEMEEKEYTFSL